MKPRSKDISACLSVAFLLVPACLLVEPGPSYASDGGGAWPPIAPSDWTERAHPDSGGREAVILDDSATLEDREGDFRLEVFRRMLVLTAEGRDAANVDVDFLKSWGEVTEIRARSVFPDGRTTELDPGQVINTNVMKLGEYEFMRKSFLIPGVEPGCIAEYQYVLKGRYKSGWYVPWHFQNPYYTRHSSLEWRTSGWAESNGLVPAWRLRNLLSSRVSQSVQPNPEHPRTISFVASALPGTRLEAWGPPNHEADATVVTYYVPRGGDLWTYWTVWKEGFEELGKEVGKKLGDLDPITDQALAQNADRWAALHEVFRWLQRRVRCVDELDWDERQSGFRDFGPVRHDFSIPGLLSRGWGIPYQINSAFAAAARKLGFQAYVILVGDRRYACLLYTI
jgi:hypothetical protein